MHSPTREEMMKLQMYDEVVDVQEKNDAVAEEMMNLQMYGAIVDVQQKNDKKQDAEGSCKAQVSSYRGTSGTYIDQASVSCKV